MVNGRGNMVEKYERANGIGVSVGQNAIDNHIANIRSLPFA
jgi:hypothetical protein